MEPPVWVVAKMAEIDPYSHIAWSFGDTDLKSGYKQPPYFALVKLYHEKDFEKELLQPPEWDRRGPIYSIDKDGELTSRPTWDTNRVPAIIAQLSDDCVASGRVLDQLKNWTIDARDKQYWQYKKMAREFDEACHRGALEAVDAAKSHAQHALKVGEQGSNPIMPKKCVPKEETAFLAGDYDKTLDNPHLKELALAIEPWVLAGWKTPEQRGLKPPDDFYEPSVKHG